MDILLFALGWLMMIPFGIAIMYDRWVAMVVIGAVIMGLFFSSGVTF